MKLRTYALIGGYSYLIIFFAAIFANFFVIEGILASPLDMVQESPMLVRFGILAFLITAVFDVFVAWALYGLYREHHLTLPSTLFRMMHAAIMGVAVFAIPFTLKETAAEGILQQIDIFNTIWLIGLFFFGIHLILLGRIIGKPKTIGIFLILAGIMYMTDTAAHFVLPNYEPYADIFLTLVAIPSILGEMALAIWLLIKGGKDTGGIRG